QHQQENHDRQSVGRMSEKQHEALDEGDLYHDVAQAHGNEIEQRKRRLAAFPASQRQGQNQKYQHRDERNYEYEEKYQHSQVYFPVNTLAQTLFAEDLSRLQGEEEEGRVVRDGRDVIGIAARERVRIVARDQLRKRILPGLRGHV